MIYLVCFGLSLLFAWGAYKTKNKWAFIACSVLSILIPVCLAGFRDYSVGTDTLNYMNKPAYWAGAMAADSLGGYLKSYFQMGYTEPLFALLMGGVAKLCGNYTVYLLLVHAIMITCVYIGAFRFRDTVNPCWILLLFFLIYYPASLNISRQYVAAAVMFAFFADIPQGKWLRYLAAVCVACLIHNSAALSLVVLVIYYVLKMPSTKLDPKARYRYVLIIGGLLFVVVAMKPMLQWLRFIPFVEDKVDYYLDETMTQPAVLATLMLVTELGALLFFHRAMQEENDQTNFLLMNSVAYLILIQFSCVIIYGKRVAAYHAFPNLVNVALLEQAVKGKYMKWLVRLAIIGAGLAYWLYVYALHNASQTFPYQFVF